MSISQEQFFRETIQFINQAHSFEDIFGLAMQIPTFKQIMASQKKEYLKTTKLLDSLSKLQFT